MMMSDRGTQFNSQLNYFVINSLLEKYALRPIIWLGMVGNMLVDPMTWRRATTTTKRQQAKQQLVSPLPTIVSFCIVGQAGGPR